LIVVVPRRVFYRARIGAFMNRLPHNLGELRKSQWSEQRIGSRSVRQEIRENLLARIERGENLFSGIHGYQDTVIPQMVNALLSRHHFILLGLRGQAKTRLLRDLTGFLDEQIPVIEGCEINDNPYRPLCRFCRDLIAKEGDATPIAWLEREKRYVEKLATPDVTVADIVGDVDPIRAARAGHDLSDELTIHYGLLPRANRGIFAINELPDLAGKIQVSLFNIMQEGDVQIKGYPIRLPLDVLLVFTANPEDYTARGKIITPLKDRIGSEIRTHYPTVLDEALAITAQESWIERGAPRPLEVPEFIRQVIEEIAFLAREDKRVDRRSGVSQRLPISALEVVASSAEQRAAAHAEPLAIARVMDIYAALPAITGKIELEYEGEMRGADAIGRELIRSAIGRTFTRWMRDENLQPVIQWFEQGGELKMNAGASLSESIDRIKHIEGLLDATPRLMPGGKASSATAAARQLAAAEFILEGLYAHKRISRSEERGFFAEPRKTEPREPASHAPRRQYN
jgi:magnesium chelatase subunit I